MFFSKSDNGPVLLSIKLLPYAATY